MKNFPQLLALVGLFSALISPVSDAHANAECEALFGRRAESAEMSKSAGDCFMALEPTADSLTRGARAMSYAFLHSKSKNFRAETVRSGFTIVKSMKTVAPTISPYWKAVFLTFEANLKDEGAVLPRHILGAIKEIREALRKAEREDPATHFHGPQRIQGILLVSMPGVVGGDARRGLEYLEEARRQSPDFSQNQLWHAKALIKAGKVRDAKDLLQPLADLDVSAMNPDFVPETQDDQAEARKILAKL